MTLSEYNSLNEDTLEEQKRPLTNEKYEEEKKKIKEMPGFVSAKDTFDFSKIPEYKFLASVEKDSVQKRQKEFNQKVKELQKLWTKFERKNITDSEFNSKTVRDIKNRIKELSKAKSKIIQEIKKFAKDKKKNTERTQAEKQASERKQANKQYAQKNRKEKIDAAKSNVSDKIKKAKSKLPKKKEKVTSAEAPKWSDKVKKKLKKA